MFTNNIAKKVAIVMKERVRIAQERFDQTCTQIDHDCASKVTEAYATRDAEKERLQDELVKSVIG